MKKTALAVAALLAACNTDPPQVLPPLSGPDGPKPTRLFFPTGLASAPDGTLLVANGNFNHAFDSGTMVTIRRSFIDSLFLAIDPNTGKPQECDVGNPDPTLAASCKRQIPQDQFGRGVLIGNYAGPLVLSDDGLFAYTGSRDSGRLNGVRVDPGGALHCLPGAGDDAKQDCRAGVIDLTPSRVDGPYNIVPGDTVSPGATAAQRVFFVSSIIPHIDSVISGVIFTSTSVAVLHMSDLSTPDPLRSPLLFSMVAGTSFLPDGGTAPGAMVFDSVRRRLYLMGCYQRSPAGFGSGEPGTVLCGNNGVNLLRILGVDANDNPGAPLEIDLHGDVHSSFTVQLLLGDPDPLTKAPATLWATMRAPDVIARIELPASPAVAPRVRKVTPLPISPADMVRIQRTGAADLLAIVAEKANSVLVYDTGADRVVAQVGRLGDSPFMIQQIPCPSGSSAFSASACLATSVFGECRVAFIEVPLNQPELSGLRGLAGHCP
jgi:hypothetical protein